MKTIILMAAMIMAASAAVYAQNHEPTALPLGSLGWDLPDADSVLAFHERPFLMGWNWISADRDISTTLGMNMWHVDDPFLWGATHKDTWFPKRAVPGQLLASTVEGISVSKTLPRRENICEAISMEWQPWLEMDATADTAVLRSDDLTGGVWGFKFRHEKGSVSKNYSDNHYRFQLERGDADPSSTDPLGTLVLDSAECDTCLSWMTETKAAFRTDILYLAINLRRSEADSLGSNPNEVVLNIRVPTWTLDESRKSKPQKEYARFRGIPSTRQSHITSTLGQDMGRRTTDVVQTFHGPTTIQITRAMLPDLTDPDITIYAMLEFTWDGETKRLRDYWNPRFVHRTERNTVADEAKSGALTSRVGIEVYYTGAVGVDIKSIRLESKEARELFWGQKDQQIANSVRTFTENMIAENTATTTPGDQPRLWRIYTRDEILPMHWKGFRYINKLLHRNTTTEWVVADVAKAKHCLELKEFWTGSTIAINAQIGSPLFRHGLRHHRDPQRHLDSLELYAGHQAGRDDFRDYETRLHVWRQEGITTINRTAGPLPLPADSIDFYVNSYDAGVLGHIEFLANYGFRDHPQLLFDPSIVRIDNIWEYAAVTAVRDTNATLGQGNVNGRPRIDPLDKPRVKSVEEMRLQSWMSLVLGAKGLIHYPGVTQSMPDNGRNAGTPGGWPINPHTGLPEARLWVVTGAAHQIEWQPVSNLTGDARIDSDALGADYLQQDDPSRYTQYLPKGLAATALALNANQSNAPGFPLFRKSMRQVIREVQRSIKPFTDTLMELQMVAWRAKGFESWRIGDTSSYSSWLHRDVSKYKVWVPAVADPNVQAMVRPRPEPYDSTFFDITLFGRKGTSLDTLCYVGVLNRRTDPRLDTTRGQDNVMTYDQLKTYMGANPDSLYQQYGARRIRIPFNYTRHEQGHGNRAVNLRVQELRADGSLDNTMINRRPPLDTIVGHATALDVDFLPGEGKIFRVSVVAASSEQNAGFLDHSNQRKIVAYPTVIGRQDSTDVESIPPRTWTRIVAGDTMYYHRVFHRRDSGSAQIDPLAVWYQRSHPLSIGTIAEASTIQWEAPINISSRIMVDTTIGSLSCGYPAIVVRPNLVKGANQDVAEVYVVFACEGANQFQPEILVCETILPAEHPRANQEDAYQAGYSQVLDVLPGVMNLDDWGTPMINASVHGNYYCWSHPEQGIGVGYKVPGARTFKQHHMDYIRYDPVDIASHPSLNTYSRLHIGETDAGLVWQEGKTPAEGSKIFYTRLFLDATDQLAHGLTPTVPTVKGPPIISPNDPNIAVLAGANTQVTVGDQSEDVQMRHAFPVLYRQLSDWDVDSMARHYEVGLHNYKAERAYWQSRPIFASSVVGENWCIGRRVFDLSVGSLRGPVRQGNVLPDSIWSHSENVIFSNDVHLKGPDVTQGEQWGEWGSVPAHNAWGFDDSTSVLEFWSEAPTLPEDVRLWHMRLSWFLYGTDADYDHHDLVAAGSVLPLHDRGSHPHLAARHSMRGAANRGWFRNRRIFSAPHVNDGTYKKAPSLWTSSEYFYRGADDRQPQAHPYVGFRGQDGDLLTSPLQLIDVNEWVPFRAQMGSEPGTTETTVLRYATEWMLLPDVVDVELGVVARGAVPVGSIQIQSERTQETVVWPLNTAGESSTDDVGEHLHATLLCSPTDRYRVVVEPFQTGREEPLWPAQDLEIVMPLRTELSRTGFDRPLRKHLIDLRTMRSVAAADFSALHVYPNPTSELMTVAVNLPTENGEWYSNLGLQLTDAIGNVVWSASCMPVDLVTIDTSPWPQGTYTVTVRDERGFVTRSFISVIR